MLVYIISRFFCSLSIDWIPHSPEHKRRFSRALPFRKPAPIDWVNRACRRRLCFASSRYQPTYQMKSLRCKIYSLGYNQNTPCDRLSLLWLRVGIYLSLFPLCHKSRSRIPEYLENLVLGVQSPLPLFLFAPSLNNLMLARWGPFPRQLLHHSALAS